MAEKPSNDIKLDLSSLPRGAIGIKGLPISRNTRLPSIRSPRDLTLGAPPKRTFLPNIPVRREKKSALPENNSVRIKQENDSKIEGSSTSFQNDKRRGKDKKAVIQTSGIFSEGYGDGAARKGKIRDSYQKSDFVSSRGTNVKKEKLLKNAEPNKVSDNVDDLYNDNFIDDGDDDDIEMIFYKPTIFPIVKNEIKKEVKTEEAESVIDNNINGPKEFDQNIAKKLGFDVNRVAKFIKKEKEECIEDDQTLPDAAIPQNDILNLLTENGKEPRIVLLQFPSSITVLDKMDLQSENSQRQKPVSNSIGSLPEGRIGKLQFLKSGKARLKLGSLIFEIGSVTHLRTKHEIVSIKTNENSGDLNVLGYVQDKFVFDPNIDNLLT